MARSPKVAPPLPDREQILAFLAEQSGKAGKREVARAFGISGGADRIALKRLLKDMAEDGLIEGRRKRLRRPGDLPSVTLLSVVELSGEGEPVGVPVDWDAGSGAPPRVVILADVKPRGRSKSPGVGDRVLARLAPAETGDGYVGRVIKVLERPVAATLGVVRMRDGQARIVPVERRGQELTVAPGGLNGALDGELVSVAVEQRARLGLASARVLERIGDVSSEKAVSLIALAQHDIPYVFPQAVLDEAEDAPAQASMAHREDWRDLPLITIDPADARDHDDAVHARPDPDHPGGFILTIAIADVSWYVRSGSALDREAEKRGNSVYFPGRVVPMLPERISNDLCSLHDEEDRPALAIRLAIDADGRKRAQSVHRIMMRSAAKLAYEEAQAAIDGRSSERTAPLVEPILKPLWAAYAALCVERHRREPLAIDLPERKVILDAEGRVDRVSVPPRLDAHRLIEEFMIRANVAAAEILEAKRAPVVYRIHDEPSWEKLDALRDFLDTLDIPLAKAGNLRPAQFNGILQRVEDTPNALLVNEVVLRSQSQAEYSIANIGHFGLNLRRYAHFTSPIRRYADLIVHRSLVSALGLGDGGLRERDAERLERTSADISAAERRAMAAERDTVDRLIASWLAERVGAVFDGRIRGVTRAGLFVEMTENGADGFVPISTIGDDYYVFEEEHRRLVGRATGETFRLGDAVEVRLAEALPFAGSLRFELLRERSGAGRRAVPGRKPGNKRASRRTRL